MGRFPPPLLDSLLMLTHQPSLISPCFLVFKPKHANLLPTMQQVCLQSSPSSWFSQPWTSSHCEKHNAPPKPLCLSLPFQSDLPRFWLQVSRQLHGNSNNKLNCATPRQASPWSRVSLAWRRTVLWSLFRWFCTTINLQHIFAPKWHCCGMTFNVRSEFLASILYNSGSIDYY